MQPLQLASLATSWFAVRKSNSLLVARSIAACSGLFRIRGTPMNLDDFKQYLNQCDLARMLSSTSDPATHELLKKLQAIKDPYPSLVEDASPLPKANILFRDEVMDGNYLLAGKQPDPHLLNLVLPVRTTAVKGFTVEEVRNAVEVAFGKARLRALHNRDVPIHGLRSKWMDPLVTTYFSHVPVRDLFLTQAQRDLLYRVGYISIWVPPHQGTWHPWGTSGSGYSCLGPEFRSDVPLLFRDLIAAVQEDMLQVMDGYLPDDLSRGKLFECVRSHSNNLQARLGVQWIVNRGAGALGVTPLFFADVGRANSSHLGSFYFTKSNLLFEPTTLGLRVMNCVLATFPIEYDFTPSDDLIVL